jgi:L-threonylcarbamoyladenylate synthase
LGLPARAAPTELLDDTPEGFARELYAALYRLERQRPARLLVEEPPREAAWRAVLDRVLRACA